MTVDLRDYQKSAINELRNGFKAGHRHQVLQLCTGSGKTVIAASIAKTAYEKGGRVWFVVDNLELVEQTVNVFESFGLDCGVIQGKHEKTDYRKDVQIVTAQTITRRWHIIDANPQWRPALIIIDECHVIYSAHREMIGMFKDQPIIGLSATPWAKGMANMYSRLVVGATAGQLMREGYLCNYEAFAPSTPDMKGVKVQAGDYKPDELDKKVNNKQITASVVDTWLHRGENRQTICFGVNVAHSKAITEEFNSRGVVAAHIDGYTDKEERAEIISSFKDGRINVLSSVGVLTKGFDAPTATCLIIARPTKSLMLHIQILGRILRKSPCGKDALILDHSGNMSRLGFPDDDMPDFLSDDRKVDQLQRKKEEKEKELKSPKPCQQCSFLHNAFKCPSCGFVPVVDHGVEELKGELVKIKQSASEKRNKNTPKHEKQAMWSAFLSVGKSRGHSSHLYRDYYSVWPRSLSDDVSLATKESIEKARKFKTARMIRYANRRR